MNSKQSQFIYQNAPWICWFEKLTIKPWLLFFPFVLFYQLIIFLAEGYIVDTAVGIFSLIPLTLTPIMFLWVLNLVKMLHSKMVKFDANVPSFEGVILSRFGAILETIGAVFYALLANIYIIPLLIPGLLYSEGSVNWGNNILTGVMSFFGIYGMSFVVRTSWFYMQVAGDIRISLFESNLYTFFSDLFIHVIIMILVMISVPSFSLSLAKANPITMILFFLLIFSPILAITFLPVAKIAKRIRAVKQAELDKIQKLISDEAQSLNSDKLCISAKIMELYSTQEQLNSIWVWPFSSYTKKLILFGLLPPFSWLAGAYLENVMGQMM